MKNTVLVYRIVDYKVKGRKECFGVTWPSCRENSLIEIGVVAVQKKDKQWKVVELEIPEDISEYDLKDIISCYWYVIDKKSFNRKRPPLVNVWEFDCPQKLWIAACLPPGNEKWVSFAKQLKEFQAVEDFEITWTGLDFFDAIRKLGPAACTAASGSQILQFDVLETGELAEPSFCPVFQNTPGRPADQLIKNQFLTFAVENGTLGIVVRSFTEETVCTKNKQSQLIRIPVKEIRGYIIKLVAREEGKITLNCEKLPLDAVKKSFCYDAATGQYVGLTVNEWDHKFV